MTENLSNKKGDVEVKELKKEKAILLEALLEFGIDCDDIVDNAIRSLKRDVSQEERDEMYRLLDEALDNAAKAGKEKYGKAR